MKRTSVRWEKDFPIREEAEDFSGKIRIFVITCHEGPLGFTVRAVEEECEDRGYEFGAYSETSPYSALGRLRVKMRRALAERHITGKFGRYRMLHDKLRGRIGSDGKGGALIVIDGVPLTIDHLASILEGHEGWEFELWIKDGLD